MAPTHESRGHSVQTGESVALSMPGGGLIENPPASTMKNSYHIDCAARPLPPIFGWLRDQGAIEIDELARTFNCGIGLLIFVDSNKSYDVLTRCKTAQSRMLDSWKIDKS